MVDICQHIKDNGIRCGSPALRGRNLCYFHDKEYRRHRIPKNAGCKLVPVLRNDRDLRIATSNIMRAIRDGAFSVEEVKLMLYALQIARSGMPVPRGHRPRKDQQTE